MSPTVQHATFGSGCFWCGQAFFQQLVGVQQVVVGYAGGQKPHPTYEDVCGGQSGYAEVFQVSFDPQVITYRQLVEIFFATHNPTTLNQQGHDVGEQYRSVIFTHDNDQHQIAEMVRDQLTTEHLFDQPIVTAIQPLTNFYPAEDYHQDYYTKNPDAAYCQAVINPKLSVYKQKFASLIRRHP